MKTVVGMFSDANEAQRTLDELVTSGFGLPNISVVTSPGMRGGMRLELMALDASDAGRISARGPLADSMAKHAGSDRLDVGNAQLHAPLHQRQNTAAFDERLRTAG